MKSSSGHQSPVYLCLISDTKSQFKALTSKLFIEWRETKIDYNLAKKFMSLWVITLFLCFVGRLLFWVNSTEVLVKGFSNVVFVFDCTEWDRVRVKRNDVFLWTKKLFLWYYFVLSIHLIVFSSLRVCVSFVFSTKLNIIFHSKLTALVSEHSLNT